MCSSVWIISIPLTETIKMQMNQWNPWSEKSAAVAFDHCPAKGVGKGEYKVAAELGVEVLGQNVSHDINIPEGPGEVKQLDSDNSIRCGKNVRDAYRPIMSRIMSLLSIFADAGDMTILPAGIRATLAGLSMISPDEICQTNLKKIETACADLSAIRNGHLASLPNVSLFDPITGVKRDVRADLYYQTALASGATHERMIEVLGSSVVDVVYVTSRLCHPYVQTLGQLRIELDGCRSVFKGYVLVIVDAAKGFYPMTSPDEKIVMYRVTSTTPRFRVPV